MDTNCIKFPREQVIHVALNVQIQAYSLLMRKFQGRWTTTPNTKSDASLLTFNEANCSVLLVHLYFNEEISNKTEQPTSTRPKLKSGVQLSPCEETN